MKRDNLVSASSRACKSTTSSYDAASASAADGSAAGSAAGSTDSSAGRSADGSTAGSTAGRPSDGSSAAAGNDASAAGDDASSAAGRYYPATGMWRLPGAVPGRRRRAAVLQGARLQRVRERGRGDRHVPVLRRGPVAAAGGGLLQRRGDRARAVEEVDVRQLALSRRGG